MKRTIIVIEVRDDREDREWWRALELPDPVRWADAETFGEDVFPEVKMEEELS